jgi:hypothetical protein
VRLPVPPPGRGLDSITPLQLVTDDGLCPQKRAKPDLRESFGLALQGATAGALRWKALRSRL